MEQTNKAFECAITHELMIDPVIDPDGYSYEREAIEEWLKTRAFSPMTRKPMTKDDLKPNRSLKEAIENSKRRVATRAAKTTDSSKVNDDDDDDDDRDVSAVSLRTVYDAKESTLCCTVTGPTITAPLPMDVVVVVDTSGSMQTDATVKNTSGQKETHGLSVLDIVKHSAKTIIHTLTDQDRFALVEFNHRSRVVCEPCYMTKQNKSIATNLVASLEASGRTNLWGGLEEALNVLTTPNPSAGRNHVVMLLTDGVPNVVPPQGHLKMLQRYAESRFKGQNLPCRVYTFGFGYELDSTLLFDLASETSSTFGFIPDAAMVGTIFVNAISNIRCTTSFDVSVNLKLPKGLGISNVVGYDSEREIAKRKKKMDSDSDSEHTETICLGTLHSGQSRSLVVKLLQKTPMSDGGDKTTLSTLTPVVSASFRDVRKDEAVRPAMSTMCDRYPSKRVEWECLVETCRLRLIHVLRVVTNMKGTFDVKKVQAAMSHIRELGKWIEAKIEECPSSEEDAEDRLTNILNDLEGEITLAVASKNYEKWGKHYLLSMLHAHFMQFCNNFKDKSVESYGGKLFEKLRDEADNIFCSLPPPTPSKTSSSTSSSTARSRSVSPPQPPMSMRAAYYNNQVPCFRGDAQVSMADGSLRRVEDILPGDVVACDRQGGSSTVEWVVRTKTRNGVADLVRLTGDRGKKTRVLWITPHHPVLFRPTTNELPSWVFPSAVGTVERTECDAVYSFMLSPSSTTPYPTVIVGDVVCASLGHGDTTSKTALSHSYFGNRARVRQDLHQMTPVGSSFPLSRVVELVEGTCVSRDPTTGLVCGLSQA